MIVSSLRLVNKLRDGMWKDYKISPEFANLKSIMKHNWRATVVFAKLHMITMFT